MSKPATLWRTPSGLETVTADNAGFSLLLEDGGNILQETSFDLLLEDNIVTRRIRSAWESATKNLTGWATRDGLSTAIEAGYDRTTESGDTRITEQGDTRVSEPLEYPSRPRTEWNNG